MKKTELKRLLKPMIKECIKECLYEEGVLSSVVSEVVEGLTPTQDQRSPEEMASSPLGGTDPRDPGVDISGIVALGGKNWKAFMG